MYVGGVACGGNSDNKYYYVGIKIKLIMTVHRAYYKIAAVTINYCSIGTMRLQQCKHVSHGDNELLLFIILIPFYSVHRDTF
jgi:hypothetical protein